MMIKNILLLVCMVLMFGSCGSKKSESTTIKFNVASLIAPGSQSTLDGGVLVAGRMDDSESFKMVLKNGASDITLDLKKGKWEFAAIAWHGDFSAGEPFFKGQNRCAYTGPVEIKTDNFAVNFYLNANICKSIPNSMISNSAFFQGDDQFKTMSVKTCNVLDTANKTCEGGGLTRSFRVGSFGWQKGFYGQKALPSVESACVNMDVDTTVPTATNLKIPVGNLIDGTKRNLMDISLFAFTEENCMGRSIEYRFVNSLYGGINQENLNAVVDPAGTESYYVLLLEHNSNTVSNNIGFSPYGFGKDGNITLSSATQIDAQNYGKITDIFRNAEKQKTEIVLASTDGSLIQQNDEVLVYVNNASCGAGFVYGMFFRARVLERASTPTNKILLDRDISIYQLNPLVIAGATTLNYPVDAGGAGFPSSCSMQVVKVMNYANVTLSGSGSLISTGYSSTSGKGGILAFNVSGELLLTSGATSFGIWAKGAATSSGESFNPARADCYSVGKACMYLGITDQSSQGGGILFANINRVKMEGTSAQMLSFKADAPSSSADGGHVNVNVGDLVTNSNLQTISISAKNNPYVSTSGPMHFRYCQSSRVLDYISFLPAVDGSYVRLEKKCQ